MCVSGGAAEQEQQGDRPARSSQPTRRLPRCLRITDSTVFRDVFERGVRYPGRLMVMLIRHADDANRRLGVVAGKRTHRRSVDRVRAKRLMREAFRLNRFRIRGRVDVLLIARRGIRTSSMQDVERELLRLMRRARILGDDG